MSRFHTRPVPTKTGTLSLRVTVPRELVSETLELYDAGYTPNDLLKEGIRKSINDYRRMKA